MVHVVVVPETDIEIVPQSLARSDTLEKSFDISPDRQRQFVLGQDSAKCLLGLLVPSENEENLRVIEYYAIEPGPVLRKAPQHMRGLAVMSARKQRASCQEPEGGSVGAIPARLDRGPPKESIGCLRSSRIDKTLGESEHPLDCEISGHVPVGVRGSERFGPNRTWLRTTGQIDAGRKYGGCEAAVSVQCLQGAGMQVWRLAPKTPVRESRSNLPTASSAFGPVNAPSIVKRRLPSGLPWVL